MNPDKPASPYDAMNQLIPRRTMIKGLAASTAVAASAGVMPSLRGAAASQDNAPKTGGVLRAGQQENMSSLDPHFSIFGGDRDVLFQIFDTVTRFDEQLNVLPCLAESWEVVDPTTYTFTFRQGVTFHDGTAMNAEAFKFNIERIKTAGDTSPFAADFSAITSIDIVDEYTAKLTLSEPVVALPAMLADRGGMMISPTAAAELGDEFENQPVGAGPFQFVEYIPDDRIVVERFPEYWEPNLPYLDGITWSIIPDQHQRFADLQAGEIDITLEVAPQDITSLKEGIGLDFLETLSLGFEDLRFDCSEPPFDNIALRQACAWAMDRQAIVDEVYLGHAEVARGPFPPTTWAANADLKGFPRDLEKARELLVEAGYPDGVDVEWDVPTGGDNVRRAEAMQAQVAEVGIRVTLNPMDKVEAKQRELDGTFQAEALSWTGRADPDLTMFSLFHTAGGYNTMGYTNARVDDLIEQARLTADQAERKAMYDEAQAIVVEEAPRLFIVHRLEVAAFQPIVQGVHFYADARTRYTWTWLDQ